MAPVLDYFIISSSIEGREEIGEFVIPRHEKGVLLKKHGIALRCVEPLVMILY